MPQDSPLTDAEHLRAQFIHATDQLAQCALCEDTRALRDEVQRQYAALGELIAAWAWTVTKEAHSGRRSGRACCDGSRCG